MVRTKKHFRPPSSSSSSSSSEEEDDNPQQQQIVGAARGGGKQLRFPGGGKQLSMMANSRPGGGKQLSMMANSRSGGGKQLRMAPQEDNDSEDSDDSSDESDEDETPSKSVSVTYGRPGGGKQLRPAGGGKQLRAPQADDDEEESDSDSDEDSDKEEGGEEKKPPTTSAVYRPSGGKSFGKQLGSSVVDRRSMGKQLRPPSPDVEEDDSDSSSESEEGAPKSTTVVVQRGFGGGKQLRPPPAAEEDDSADDMEESEDEDEPAEKEAPKQKPESESEDDEEPAAEKEAPKQKPESESEGEEEPALEQEPPKQKPESESESESDSDEEPEEKRKQKDETESESEPEPEPEPRPSGRPKRAAAGSAKKIVEESSSSASEESSSESEEEHEWDMETFDTQKLVQGDDDQNYLDSLPELEREAILAERFEKLKSEADMKKALRENKRKEREQKKMARAQKGKAPGRKRAAPAKAKAEPPKKKEKKEVKVVEKPEEKDEDESDDDEKAVPDTSGDAALAQSMAGKRVSTRNLDAKGNKFKKAAALAKIRENRASKGHESDSDLDYGRDSDDSDDDYEESTMLKPWQQKGKKTTQLSADDSADDASFDEEDDRHQRSRGESDRRNVDLEAQLEDYVKVTIPRRRLMRWCNEPFFGNAVQNFYVRLGIGRDKKTQKACYRLCRIIDVVSKGEYTFPPVENQKPISTNKWLKVSFGKFVNTFKMITVSDHRPSDEDVSKYVSQLKTERQSDDLLLRKTANKLRKKQDELVNNYTYTKEDIENLVKEKKKRNKKALNIGMEKTRIAIAVQAAKDAVEEAKRRLEEAKIERMESDDISRAESNVVKASEALEDANANLQDKIEEQKRIHKDEHDRINRLKQSSKVQNWVKVNQRAKLANQNADFQSYKEQLAKEKAEGTAEPKFDPFARRRVKPRNLWEVGGKDKASEVSSNDAVQEEKKETLPSERDDSNVGKDGDKDRREEITESQKVDVLGQSNQFAFDDEIMIGGDLGNIGGIGSRKSRSRARKGISLDDYQERKASGTL